MRELVLFSLKKLDDDVTLKLEKMQFVSHGPRLHVLERFSLRVGTSCGEIALIRVSVSVCREMVGFFSCVCVCVQGEVFFMCLYLCLCVGVFPAAHDTQIADKCGESQR